MQDESTVAPAGKYLSLAARYRPQTFAAVAGQPLAAVALSRAAAADKIAPAYLLSGTRGVGKTTIARIFAKALNCEKAPAGEPCNECDQCRHVTAGNHVDVNEIDAASNTGVEDVRALRETIGFLPMEGRYKIFIVDEAHMLSKSAFNALLKTLEEPPAHTVFIFATTEVHRFPATIISRCQHFVFRHLPEEAIYGHLARVLQKENVEFEEQAGRLLARRAAGSVRDSLSLLDQALAVSSGKLTAETVRKALGLAGAELFDDLLAAIAAPDVAKVVDLSGGLLRSGVDMGFFTRELGGIWRNLFLLRQSGDKILPALACATDDEKAFLRKHAQAFSLGHLHAAWQMTLESQRGIAQSPEPGAALELLLLNLALLPRLLPVGEAAPQVLAENAAPYARNEIKTSSWHTEACASEKIRPVKAETDVPKVEAANADIADTASADTESASVNTVSAAKPETAQTSLNWRDFCEFCRAGAAPEVYGVLRGLQCDWTAETLRISFPAEASAIFFDSNRQKIETALSRYCGGMPPAITCQCPQAAKSNDDLKAECGNNPGVRLCQDILDARIDQCIDKNASARM